jgi:hypothetical protein
MGEPRDLCARSGELIADEMGRRLAFRIQENRKFRSFDACGETSVP